MNTHSSFSKPMTMPVGAWLLAIALALTGCKVYSTIDIANTEVPERMQIRDYPPSLIEKYAVNGVIVRPMFMFSDGYQTKYMLLVAFYSERHPVDVSIQSINFKVDGQDIEYGKEMVGTPPSSWTTDPLIAPYYSAHIAGEPIAKDLKKMIRSKADLTLTIAVKRDDGTVVEKEIAAHFEPRERSHFLTM